MPINKNIEDWLVMAGELHIDFEWALDQFVQYRHEIMLAKNGVPYAELGIGRRRAESMPGIIEMTAQGPRIVNNPVMLNEPDATPPGSFAHLRLQGVMRSGDGASSRGITSLIGDLNSAYANDNIEGILLEANTGGGEATAGDMLMSAILDSPKAVVVYAHTLASAGIKGTLGADEIIASGQSARLGSIGSFITLDKTFGKYYSMYYEDVYADKSTKKNQDFREFLKGNLEPLRKQLNQSNDYFLADVQKHRPLKGDVEDTLSGAMFFASAAKRRGLADGIGSFNHAVKRLQANVERRKMK